MSDEDTMNTACTSPLLVWSVWPVLSHLSVEMETLLVFCAGKEKTVILPPRAPEWAEDVKRLYHAHPWSLASPWWQRQGPEELSDEPEIRDRTGSNDS